MTFMAVGSNEFFGDPGAPLPCPAAPRPQHAAHHRYTATDRRRPNTSERPQSLRLCSHPVPAFCGVTFLVVGPVTCRSYCCPTTSQQNHHTTSQIRLLCIQFFICTCGILQIYVSPFRISCDGFQRISGERKFQKKEWPGSSKRGRRPRRRHGQSSVTQGG
jgi:hypothetical protein